MYANTAWQSYKRIATNTAPPGQLVLMLFDGALRFLRQAVAAFEAEDPLELNEAVNNNVIKAQRILDELNHSLDFERGGELARTLQGLYTYMDSKLTESNLRKTPAGIEETIKHLQVLRTAWYQMLSGQTEAGIRELEPIGACLEQA